MEPERDAIEELLQSVAEGTRVDWEGTLESTDGAERQHLANLRDLARIADFHRDRIADTQPELSELPERWGDLVILERLGRGAHSDVVRAWDPKLQREVALKLLHRETSAGSAAGGATPLEREGRAAAKVRHPHVVTIHGVDRRDGRVGLWMELVKGATLEDEVARRGPLPADEVARLGREIGAALAAVHAAGVLHRDVKPANIVRDAEGRFVLVDFGLGAHTYETPSRGGAGPRGTPLYMAPEVLAGGAATVRTELYALALTMRFALTGKHAFDVESLAELTERARGGAPSLSGAARASAGSALSGVIERGGAPDPEARWSSAGEMVGALSEVSRRRARASRGIVPKFALAAASLVLLAAVGAIWIAERNGATNVAYAVDAVFLRHDDSGARRLGAGDRLTLGDQVSLELRATRPVHAYVLNEDDRGERYLLFPQPMFDLGNPIPADTVVVLPGTIGGRENAWSVTSRGGRERFLVVVSPEPVEELEAELSRLPAPKRGRPIEYASVTTEAVERLRGVGGIDEVRSSVESANAAGGDLFAHFRALSGAENEVRGVWVRHVVFENPAE